MLLLVVTGSWAIKPEGGGMEKNALNKASPTDYQGQTDHPSEKNEGPLKKTDKQPEPLPAQWVCSCRHPMCPTFRQ